MFDRTHPRTRSEVENLVAATFPEDLDVIVAAVKPAVAFVRRERVDGKVALALGGDALLPPWMSWPVNGDRELDFVAAVDMSVAGVHDVTGSLPTNGLLLFFYDIASQSWGLDPSGSDAWRVIRVDERDRDAIEPRRRRTHPSDARYLIPTPIDPDELGDAAPTWTLPMNDEPCVRGTVYGSPRGDSYRARMKDFAALSDFHSMSFQMMGWPYYTQPNPRQWAVEVASSGRSWDEVTELDVAPWRLLMQLPKWDEYGGTRWGGPGPSMLEYWIREKDLLDERFDRTWIQMDA